MRLFFTNPNKLALIAFLFSFTSFSAAAQGLYVKVIGSYHFGLGSNPASSSSGNIPGTSFTIKNERVGINYSKGAIYNATLGYMFNGNIGAELTYGYLKSNKMETESRYYYPEYYVTETRRFETYSRMNLIQPAIILTAENGKLKPYAKLGLLLALGKIYESRRDALYSESREMKGEFSGGYGFGFQSAAGLTLQASNNIDFFMELTMNNLSYAPEKWTITEAKENGADVLYKYEEEITFSDEYVQSYTVQGDPEKVRGAHRIHLPMSSLGIGLGMKVRF